MNRKDEFDSLIDELGNEPKPGERYVIALRDAMEQARKYARHNWGQKYGSDFPEIAKEIMSNDALALRLGLGYVFDQLQGHSVANSLAKGVDKIGNSDKDLPHLVNLLRDQPDIYERALEFFYYGLIAGRRLQREEDQTLRNIAEATHEHEHDNPDR